MYLRVCAFCMYISVCLTMFACIFLCMYICACGCVCSLQKVYLNGNKLSEIPDLWSQLPQLKVRGAVVVGTRIRAYAVE